MRFKGLVVVVVALVSGVCMRAHADDAPMLLNYQGRLASSGGALLSGSHSMQFCLYDDCTAGNQLWCEVQNVTVTQGAFSVLLGSATPLPDSLFTHTPEQPAGTRCLEVAVGGETLSPRRRIASAPYALHAKEDGLWYVADQGEYPSKLRSDVVGGLLLGNLVTPTVTQLSVATNDTAFLANIRNPTAQGGHLGEAFDGNMLKDTLEIGDRIGVRLGFFANNTGPVTDTRFYSSIEAVVEDPQFGQASSGLRFLTGGSQGLGMYLGGVSKGRRVGIGTAEPQAKLEVANGDVYPSTGGTGVILKSPNGSVCRRLGIDNSGAMILTSLTCP